MGEDELFQRTQSELRSGELVYWTGQPIPKRLVFSASSLVTIIFGLFWTSFSVFWVVTAAGIIFLGKGENRADGFWACFPLFGVPFILIGLLILSAPFQKYRAAKWTSYVITNQRAIIWNAGAFRSLTVRSFMPSELMKLTRRDYQDGSGDIIFQSEITEYRDSDGDRQTRTTEHGFMAIAEVRDVEKLIETHLTAQVRREQ